MVVVCLSKDSVSKTGFIQKELKFALDVADEQPEGAIFMIPLRLEPVQAPERLRKWQWLDLVNDRMGQDADMLSERPDGRPDARIGPVPSGGGHEPDGGVSVSEVRSSPPGSSAPWPNGKPAKGQLIA